MKSLQKERDLLRGAVNDLKEELKSLQAQKKEYEQTLRDVSRKTDIIKEQEIKLRNLISLSMKKEAALLKKKGTAKDKIAEVEKKIEKVTTVKRQLGDL